MDIRARRLAACRRTGEERVRLTPRQREVALAVAEGLSNEEIAARLVVTPGRVANHLEQSLRRLTLRNRTQLAIWTVWAGLYEPSFPFDATEVRHHDSHPARDSEPEDRR
jgi:DNA-binding NarL/FixJ family response regulator